MMMGCIYAWVAQLGGASSSLIDFRCFARQAPGADAAAALGNTS